MLIDLVTTAPIPAAYSRLKMSWEIPRKPEANRVGLRSFKPAKSMLSASSASSAFAQIVDYSFESMYILVHRPW